MEAQQEERTLLIRVLCMCSWKWLCGFSGGLYWNNLDLVLETIFVAEEEEEELGDTEMGDMRRQRAEEEEAMNCSSVSPQRIGWRVVQATGR